jgi:hypothetical protein
VTGLIGHGLQSATVGLAAFELARRHRLAWWLTVLYGSLMSVALVFVTIVGATPDEEVRPGLRLLLPALFVLPIGSAAVLLTSSARAAFREPGGLGEQ